MWLDAFFKLNCPCILPLYAFEGTFPPLLDYPGGLTSHNLVFSDFLYPALFLCSVMVIEWLGLPLGAKFPFGS